ncbi:uncharacterized protein LOC134807419 isoform X2 [Pan troglodytes]|uniref:uncharacterized protein LOC134807419 isoform X2 n=1 Tax=Pan troglodytes TaxID=9598 RepID=UPI00301382E8
MGASLDQKRRGHPAGSGGVAVSGGSATAAISSGRWPYLVRVFMDHGAARGDCVCRGFFVLEEHLGLESKTHADEQKLTGLLPCGKVLGRVVCLRRGVCGSGLLIKHPRELP